jgi:predicted PurR-regulated permease PerM
VYLSVVPAHRIVLIVVSCVLVAVAIVVISLFTIFREVTETTNELMKVNNSIDSALQEIQAWEDSMANDPFLQSLDSNSFSFETIPKDSKNYYLKSDDSVNVIFMNKEGEPIRETKIWIKPQSVKK